MSTHTPGNWIVSYASEDDGGCSIVSPTGTVAWHVSEANASLIASAPDLLAALRTVQILRSLGGLLPGSREIVMLAVEAADEAIAKATGETT